MSDPPSAYDLLQTELGASAPAPAAPDPGLSDVPGVATAPPPAPTPGADALTNEQARYAPPDRRTALQNLAQGTRDVLQGAATLPGLVYDSLGNLINLGEKGLEGLSGADLGALRIHPLAQNIDRTLDAAGLPPGAAQPGWQSKLIRALSAPLGGGALGSAIGATAAPGGAAEAVGGALTAALPTQMAVSAAPEVAGLYTDPALEGHPALQAFAKTAAGLAAAGSITGLQALLSSPSVDPEIAAWATRARNVYNIPLTATDMSQNAAVRTLSSVNRNMLWSGAGNADAAITDGLNRAISNTIGENTTRITAPVMDAARTRIGNELDRIGNATTLQFDNPLLQDLTQIEGDARSSMGYAPGVAPSPDLQSVLNQIDRVQNTAAGNNGVIPGSVFQNMIAKGAPLDRVASSGDPNVAHYGQQIREALFDAFERSAPPDELQALQDARFQYKNMKTIEPLVEKSPTGALSPALLTGAARSSFDNMAYQGAGPLGELGQIGQMFLKPPPDSYTAMRNLLIGAVVHPTTAVPTLGLSMPLNRLLGAGLRSDALANRTLYGGAPVTAPTVAGRAAMSLIQPDQRDQGDQ
jgi:hypothetical protein